MAINMSRAVYNPCQYVFGRPAVFTSTLGNSFSGAGRGIYTSEDMNIVLEDGSIMSDQKTIFDIRAEEFPILPVQGDTLSIPFEPVSQTAAAGDFEITNAVHNGGGEVTLTLRAIVSSTVVSKKK